MRRWIAVCALALLFVPAVSWAAEENPSYILEGRSQTCVDTGRCTVCDILVPFKNLSVILMGLTGPILLLVIAYGGFTWLISGGDSAKVEQGRKIMVGGVIGVLVVFAAWEIVNITIFTLTKPASTNLGAMVTQPWSTLNCN